METLLCLLGMHDWRFGEDFSLVRDVNDDEKMCVCCGAERFWADGRWMNDTCKE